jgi:hypothetical protein
VSGDVFAFLARVRLWGDRKQESRPVKPGVVFGPGSPITIPAATGTGAELTERDIEIAVARREIGRSGSPLSAHPFNDGQAYAYESAGWCIDASGGDAAKARKLIQKWADFWGRVAANHKASAPARVRRQGEE